MSIGAPTRVVLADDAALLREGLAGLLARQGFDVVAQASRSDELEQVVDGLAVAGELPSLVVTDVRMPPGMASDGLEAAVRLKQRHPSLGVMVLSQYVAAAHAQELFALTTPGGTGYLLKDRVADVADFIAALRVVVAGGMAVDPQVTRAMLQAGRGGVATLTGRELEVLELMAQGLSNAQIAERLVVSGAAVAKHVANIFAKLGLEAGEENRRVRAILAYLAEARPWA